MDNFLARAQAIWAAIGAVVIVIGSSLPDWVPVLFNEEFTSIMWVAFGAVIEFYQVIRALVASSKQAEIKILSTGAKRSYLINPFKIAA